MAKEFGWSPRECKEQDSKDIKAITHILSTYNRVKNVEMEKSMKTKPSGKVSSRGGGGSGKYVRKEKIGPHGVQVSDSPM